MNLLITFYTWALLSFSAFPNELILIGKVQDFDQKKVTLQIEKRKIIVPRKKIAEKSIKPNQIVKAKLSFKELKEYNP